MVALQARAFAQAGFGVLQIDLYGCGDSSGDFAQARWDIWLGDLARAWQWLEQRHTAPSHLWGLRLGALLALEFARQVRPQGLILWHPTISGRAHLNQFARLQSAARMFTSAPAAEQNTEIAGYRMSSSLADTIGQLDAASLTPRCPVQWLELNAPPQDAAAEYARAAGQSDAILQPASALVIDCWREDGAQVHAQAVHGEPFWLTPEASISTALLAATRMES